MSIPANHVSQIIEYLTQQCWAMHLPILQQMRDIACRHLAGIRVADSEVRAIVENRREPSISDFTIDETTGKAIIPVSGVIAKYARMVNGSSQPRGTSIEQLSAQLDAALESPRVKEMCFIFETPGGSVAGLADFADKLYAAGFIKPTTAFSDDLCASAGVYLATQCVRHYCTQSAYVGSIGTYMMLYDSSKAAEDAGYKVYILRSGEHKGVGEDGVEISEENLAMFDATIKAHSRMFYDAVLRGRAEAGMTAEDMASLSDARLLVGVEAVEAKLCDGIATLEQILRADAPPVRKISARPTGEKPQFKAAAGAADTTISLKGETMPSETKKAAEAGAAEATVTDTMAVQVAAAAAERQRIAEINAALPGEALAAVRQQAIDGLKSVDEAKVLAFDALKTSIDEQLAKAQKELADANARLAVTARHGVTTVAAQPLEASGQAAGNPADAANPQLWQDCEKQLLAEDKAAGGNMTTGQARQKACTMYPLSHDAYVTALTAKKTATN